MDFKMKFLNSAKINAIQLRNIAEFLSNFNKLVQYYAFFCNSALNNDICIKKLNFHTFLFEILLFS